MHLESLSLRGFKSFERRVTLRFDRRITAVVGPNGSGKSNIADAVRWVLGEQSMQALRSKSLVDLIFAGTDRRAPVNVAEVVLTVNNEDGSLPVPYAQVSVMRRISRSGESEFFINGIPCRLREIQQLFLDTGVGRKSIALVGQGEIDALLTATPEQRRGWVEDLAGIARYQLQKEQALAKAESTRLELARLQDLIIEVRSQRDRLQAEAMRARRHRELVAKLRLAEWHLYLAARQAAEARVAAAQARLDGAQARLQEALERHRAQAAQVETLREQVASLEGALAEVAGRERQLEEALSRLERDESVLAVERRQAAQGLRAQRKERARLRSQAAGRVERWRAARRARSEAARELAAAQTALQEAEAALAAVEQEVPAGQASADLEALRAEAGRLRERLAAQQAEAKARARALEERRRQLAETEERLSRLTAAVAQARESLARHEAERERLEAELARRKAALAQAEAALQEAEAGRTREVREYERLQARLGSLRQLVEEGQGYALGPRLILQARERFPGLIGSVAELLQVPPELARAAEAALGGAGQYLVTRDERAVREAIAWLKAGGRGRATFLPLDRLRPASPLPPHHPARRAQGVLGVLAEMVGVVGGFEVLLAYFFGRTVVLETLDAALQLQKSPAMPSGGGARLVTVEGDLLLPSGAVTGGAFRQEAGGLIARQSELARLEAEGARRAQVLAQARERARQAQAALEAARRARAEAEEAWRAAAAACREGEQEVARLQRDQAALEAERDRLKSHVAAEEAEQARLQAEAQATAHGLAAVEAELARAEGEAAQREEAWQAARDRVEAALRAVGEARLTHQAAAHRYQEASRRLAEERAGWAAWREALRALDQARQAQEPERQALAQRRQALRAARRELEAALAALRAEAEARRGAYAEARRALAQGEEQAQALAGRLEALREARHRAELDLVRERSELDHLLNDAPVPPEEVQGPQGEAAAAAELPGDLEALRAQVRSLRAGLARLGPVNPAAEEAFQEIDQRYRTLEAQRDDLITARRELAEMVETIDRTSTERFRTAFAALQEALQDLFQQLFDGGEARLDLTDPDDPLHSGVELNVRPPGKRWQPLVALSGGERSLCLVALLFAMQKVRPSAFALLDEVDAALDQRNLARFVSVLEEFSERTQFVLISHRPETVEAARVLYGATLDGDGTSRLISLKVPEPEEETP